MALPAALGHEVAAVTGRPEKDYLRGLGAVRIVPRAELAEPSRRLVLALVPAALAAAWLRPAAARPLPRPPEPGSDVAPVFAAGVFAEDVFE